MFPFNRNGEAVRATRRDPKGRGEPGEPGESGEPGELEGNQGGQMGHWDPPIYDLLS